jgi:DNA invertase Pin-like site-specific DNA recombinase
MIISELVTPQHLQKKALIYIRQSTPHQQISNQESLRLQYALQERAQGLGWHADDVEIIDADLGLTGTCALHRTGFQELVAKVTLGQVGIILSVDVTRLSRNCSDWYPLLDVCGYRCCLIADNDGIYDPGSANGRLLLGLKGQLSELELHTIRARMTAGLLNKAKRGELVLTLPVGLVRDALDRVHKDPHQEIQDRLDLIFTTFLRLRSASKVLGFLNAHDLGIPRRDRLGDIIWKKPTGAAILQILKNPAYAGAFVYGRTRAVRKDPTSPRARQVRLSVEEWKFRVNDVYPAYISWEVFERIQDMLLDNYAEYDRNKTRGVPRKGSALLHGMVYCGECGHKLVVQYKGGTRYLCNAPRVRNIVCPSANIFRGMPSTPPLWKRSSRHSPPLSWMSTAALLPPSRRPSIRCLMPIISTWSVSSMKLSFPSGSSCALPLTIVSLQQPLKRDGTMPLPRSSELKKPSSIPRSPRVR